VYSADSSSRGAVWILNSTIESNRSASGGGLNLYAYYFPSNTIARNCLIISNVVTRYDGGGVYCDRGGLLQNCTIYGNRATNEVEGSRGGGIHCYFGGKIDNSIIYGNSAIDGANYYKQFGGTFSYSCTTPSVGGTSNITDNPLLTNGLRLSATSPCVNTGTNQMSWMGSATDLDGNARIIASIVDRGCYEYNFTYATGAVYGVNGAIITNGEAAGVGKGTAFTQLRANSSCTNQLSLSNACATNLIIYGTSLSGSGAAHFRVDNFPAQVAPGTKSNFNLVFAPTAAGAHAATVEIAANIQDTPYCLPVLGSAYTVSPASGPAAGGTLVAITNGTLGQAGDITNVLVGGIPAISIPAQDATWVRFTTPAHAAGTGDVVVQSTFIGQTVFSNAYIFNPAGIILSLSPTSGAAGTVVTITGSNLCDGSDVTNVVICGAAAVYISTQSATQVVAMLGPCTPGPGNVAIYSTSYGITTTNNAFTFLMPNMTVLGTNGLTIANGEAASGAKGTDFGSVSWGGAVTNTFFITNSGNTTLDINNWTTNGAGAAHFRVTGMPAAVAVGGKSNFSVVFAPSAGGTHAAFINIANSSTSTPYVVNLLGVGLPHDQSITFPPISNQVATSSVSLSATANSGLAVSFAVAEGPGQIVGTTLSFTGAGTVKIAASQAGNADWNAAANVTNSLTVSKAGQAITFPAIADQIVTSSVALSASAGSGLAVSFAVASGPGTISGGNILSFSSTGTVLVAASQAGNALWSAAPNMTNPVTVNPAPLPPAPQNLSASQGTYTDRVALAWSAASGASGYQVWRNTANDSASATLLAAAATPACTDASVVPGLTYYYWVKATNASGASAFSAGASGYAREEIAPDIKPFGADFDGDGKADPTLVISNAAWFIWLSAAGYARSGPHSFSYEDALPAPGDFDGDRKTDPALMAPATGNWMFWLSGSGYTQVGPHSFGIGAADLPLGADFDGDGKADPAVYNAGQWKIWLSASGYSPVGPIPFTAADDEIPAPRDFDGDGKADPAVCSAGQWTFWLSSAGYAAVGPLSFTAGADAVPAPGDFDGDGKADPAVCVSDSDWYFWLSSGGYSMIGPYVFTVD
jgi:hypothetical protein